MKLFSPAVARNTAPIIEVLKQWLPVSGIVLEVASGSGEHAAAFARAFPALQWQPTEIDADALASIECWREEQRAANLLAPMKLDVTEPWSVAQVDAMLAINMVHISPPEASLALLAGAAKVLPPGGSLILYGPWRVAGEPLEPSNAAFDRSLKARDSRWGLREVGTFAASAGEHGLKLIDQRLMPANNRMLRFSRSSAG